MIYLLFFILLNVILASFSPNVYLCVKQSVWQVEDLKWEVEQRQREIETQKQQLEMMDQCHHRELDNTHSALQV